MKTMKKFLAVLVLVVGLFAVLTTSAHAATLYLSSNSDTLHIGDTLEVIIKIDSEGAGVNAVQGTLQYPKDILQATKIDKGDSVFDFWLQDPSFSNDAGRVTFAGGSTVGSVGKSLQVLRTTFMVKGGGRAELFFTDSAVTASDGSGTNVLGTLQRLVVNSVPKTGTTAQVVPTLVPAPTQITRPPITASGLPIKPEITVPLFPDPSSWFNRTDAFLAQWKLPADVSAVSTALDQNVNFAGETSEGLFDSKVFPAIARDGVWYLHVRFRNNIGWGPVNNYRIAVDTHPPLSFSATVLEGSSSDNPSPTLSFKTKDSLSGIKEYQIAVDGGEAVHLAANKFSGTTKLPLLAPGKHRISIRVADNADNSAENDLFLDVLPIASPVISFVTTDLLSDKQTGVVVKGSSAPSSSVLLVLHQKDAVIAKTAVPSDANGNWMYTFDEQLKNDTYHISAQSEDSRGARSLLVESPAIVVQSRPILQLGAFKLGPGGATMFLLLLLIGSFAGGIWFWRKKQEKFAFRIGFAEAEISKIFKLILEDSNKLSDALRTSTAIDDEYAIKRLQENLKKMEEYLKRGIRKINL